MDVARHVDLRDDRRRSGCARSATSVLVLRLRVVAALAAADLRRAAVRREARPGADRDPPALVVGQVQVEAVELVERDQVDVPLDVADERKCRRRRASRRARRSADGRGSSPPERAPARSRGQAGGAVWTPWKSPAVVRATMRDRRRRDRQVVALVSEPGRAAERERHRRRPCRPSRRSRPPDRPRSGASPASTGSRTPSSPGPHDERSPAERHRHGLRDHRRCRLRRPRPRTARQHESPEQEKRTASRQPPAPAARAPRGWRRCRDRRSRAATCRPPGESARPPSAALFGWTRARSRPRGRRRAAAPVLVVGGSADVLRLDPRGVDREDHVRVGAELLEHVDRRRRSSAASRFASAASSKLSGRIPRIDAAVARRAAHRVERQLEARERDGVRRRPSPRRGSSPASR